MADLKYASLHVSGSFRRYLICVVGRYLDAFAASPTDLGRISVVVLIIKTGDTVPFCHNLSAVLFA